MSTLCWNCSKPYAMTAQVCPHCGAANANADLGAASAQAEGTLLDAVQAIKQWYKTLESIEGL